MRRDEIIAKLKEAEPALRARGVGALYLFGSYARDEARPDSDVDVFVDPMSDELFGFLNYMNAFEEIRKAVGGEVEIG
jgi:predicted nucleotidyltransferase